MNKPDGKKPPGLFYKFFVDRGLGAAECGLLGILKDLIRFAERAAPPEKRDSLRIGPSDNLR